MIPTTTRTKTSAPRPMYIVPNFLEPHDAIPTDFDIRRWAHVDQPTAASSLVPVDQPSRSVSGNRWTNDEPLLLVEDVLHLVDALVNLLLDLADLLLDLTGMAVRFAL